MTDTKKIDAAFVANTYARFPLEIVAGKGSLVWDETGKEYIDLGSGIAVTSFGIADEGWQQAVCAQMAKVQHMSNLYYTQPCAQLAQLLCEKTGMKKVFFSNSGAEANECAIKVARKYAAGKKGIQDAVIVTLNNSFHGRTLATLAATGQDHFHHDFGPLPTGFTYLEPGDLDAAKQLASTQPVAAFFIELVQGEGGVVPLDKAFVQGLAALCKEQDILLMVDEVQTGNGRTGTLYAWQQYGIVPDVCSTAKGLAGGLPLGATLLGDKVQNVLGFGDHGSTFGGNPVCSAGALHLLGRIDDKLLAEVKEKSAAIFAALQGAKGVKSVSGLGLMVGIETEKPAAEVVAQCMQRGVLALTAKGKVRLLPALNIPAEQLAKAISILAEVCAE